MSLLRELYQEVILDHNKNPRNFRIMEDATKHVEGYNPLCGDHYTIYVKMEGDVISDVSFQGAGCAISKSSASVMTSLLKGKSRKEAEQMFNDFHNLVKGELNAEENLETLGKLAAFAGVSEFPARVKCASLAWHTLHAALHDDAQRVTTE
ncbi:MAG: SUF system NifU family Fe-S cluster assembly protein [Bacteroidetes bacterium]|nr:SUF system NifU family Fe-S cluster assembly protein [Bacteroidota bacterium]MCW5897276.1 SUF system NifU family Fe-S cluster assembly protein [Bacteroidota bacterium]